MANPIAFKRTNEPDVVCVGLGIHRDRKAEGGADGSRKGLAVQFKDGDVILRQRDACAILRNADDVTAVESDHLECLVAWMATQRRYRSRQTPGVPEETAC